MKNFSKFVFVILVTIMTICSCGESSKKTESKRIARETFIKDSLERVKFVKDSLNKIEIINSHKSLFVEKSDEFSNRVWVEHKNTPKYRNQKGIYCYFQLENGVASNFRFVYQYYGDDWLFIKSMIFNIDGTTNITIVPDMDTDCGYGGKVWEWCDESVSGSLGDYIVNELFIVSLANAKNVKVKMCGSEYYDIYTLNETQIKSIKDTYEYYIALGGKFN